MFRRNNFNERLSGNQEIRLQVIRSIEDQDFKMAHPMSWYTDIHFLMT
jgi:hypothetical protein